MVGRRIGSDEVGRLYKRDCMKDGLEGVYDCDGQVNVLSIEREHA